MGKNNHSLNIRFCKMFKGRVKVGDNKTKINRNFCHVKSLEQTKSVCLVLVLLYVPAL